MTVLICHREQSVAIWFTSLEINPDCFAKPLAITVHSCGLSEAKPARLTIILKKLISTHS